MMKKLLSRKAISLFCAAVMLLSLVIPPVYAKNAEKTVIADAQAEMGDYREVTFSDFGIDDQTVAPNAQAGGKLTDTNNLDGVAFTGYLTMGLKQFTYHSFRIGGKAGTESSAWSGVGVYTESASALVVHHYTGVTGGSNICKIPIADYGITYDAATGFSEFKLRITFDYVDGTDDVHITVTVNDELAYEGDLDGAQNTLGNQVRVWAFQDKTIAVRSAEETDLPDNGDTPGGSDEEDSVTYREVTFSDFGMDDQIVPGNGQAGGKLADTDNLDGVAFTGKLQMELKQYTYHSFRIGGKAGTESSTWSGVGVYTESANALMIHHYTGVTGGSTICRIPIADYGITYDAATGFSEFTLRITFDYVDGTDDVHITVTVNDILAYEGNLDGAQNTLGNQVRVWAFQDKTISIGSVAVDDKPTEPTEPEEPTVPSGPTEPVIYREVTFSDFGIGDQTVAANGQAGGKLADVSNLDGIAFTGKLQMELKQHTYHSFRIGGKPGTESSTWSGVGVYTESANALVVHYYTGVTGGYNICRIPIADYGITYDAAAGFSEFKLRITFDYVDGTDDVHITVTVNDILAYEGNLDGAQNTLGNQLRVWAFQDKTISVQSVFVNTDTPGGDEEEEEPVTYREVTFYDFGILDQTVPAGVQAGGKLPDAENLDGIAFTGRVQMKLKQFTYYSVRIGGKDGTVDNNWSGVGVYTESANALVVHYYTGVTGGSNICRIPIANYGISYDENTGFSEFKLRITFDYVENTSNVKITVSVNDIQAYKGILYGAQDVLGNQVRVWAYDDKNVSIRSYPDGVCPEEKIDPAPVITNEFKRISFATFLFERGTYGTTEKPLSGHCRENSLDKVVFSDTLCFPEGGDVQWRFGGTDSIWKGMMFTTSGKTLRLSNTVGSSWLPIVFDPEVAGCALVGEDVKITLSFEYVDSDEDGEKDDVKLGVWFNGKAYADRCYYLTDMAPELGGHTMFYSPSGKHGITIKPYYPSLDFTIFGYTKDWEVELGLKKG